MSAARRFRLAWPRRGYREGSKGCPSADHRRSGSTEPTTPTRLQHWPAKCPRFAASGRLSRSVVLGVLGAKDSPRHRAWLDPRGIINRRHPANRRRQAIALVRCTGAIHSDLRLHWRHCRGTQTQSAHSPAQTRSRAHRTRACWSQAQCILPDIYDASGTPTTKSYCSEHPGPRFVPPLPTRRERGLGGEGGRSG